VLPASIAQACAALCWKWPTCPSARRSTQLRARRSAREARRNRAPGRRKSRVAYANRRAVAHAACCAVASVSPIAIVAAESPRWGEQRSSRPEPPARALQSRAHLASRPVARRAARRRARPIRTEWTRRVRSEAGTVPVASPSRAASTARRRAVAFASMTRGARSNDAIPPHRRSPARLMVCPPSLIRQANVSCPARASRPLNDLPRASARRSRPSCRAPSPLVLRPSRI